MIPEHSESCLFCAIARGEQPSVLVHEDALCRVFMDLYQMSPGHLLIIPRQHVVHFHELPDATASHLARVTRRLSDALMRSELEPAGYNLLNNNGRAANQHVGHLHIHIIPRYRRDSLRFLANILLHLPGAFLFSASRATLQAQADHIRRQLLADDRHGTTQTDPAQRTS